AAQKIENQFRQHRCDQSEREHVEHDGDEDERDGGLARFHAGGEHERNVVAAVVSTAEPKAFAATNASTTCNASRTAPSTLANLRNDAAFLSLAENRGAPEQNPRPRFVRH